MTKHHQDYIWKDGIPYGIAAIATDQLQGLSYKIASDPYHKRTTVEKYFDSNFVEIVYDSALFDFRHLKPALQLTWQKTPISETHNQAVCHIRNQDDQLILIEAYTFENELCRECKASSASHVPISTQKIFYTKFNDPFDGVILYDSNNHPVIIKRYKWDDITQGFTDLLEENWDMRKVELSE